MDTHQQSSGQSRSTSGSTQAPALFPVSRRLSDWESDSMSCFKGWLAQQDMSLESAKVYGFMWGKFTRWIHEHGLDLERVHSSHIAQFLNQADLIKHHRYRYVRLIERVYQYLASENPSLGNPGSEAARARIGEGTNAPTTYLEENQREKLIRWVCRDPSGEQYARKDQRWKEIRDLAMTAAMLGGGLKVGEARRLSVSCISGDLSQIEIPADNGPSHTTCLLPFARDVVRQWVALRAQMRFPGNWLFVASADGRQMDAVTLYRRVHQVMKRAGIDLEAREGPQTLRNSFVASLFAAGVDDAVVAGYLGLREPTSISRLRSRLV